MKDIVFTHTGHSAIVGNFSAGDIARGLDDAVADHFVNEAHCAKYADAVEDKAAGDVTTKPARKKSSKSGGD